LENQFQFHVLDCAEVIKTPENGSGIQRGACAPPGSGEEDHRFGLLLAGNFFPADWNRCSAKSKDFPGGVLASNSAFGSGTSG